MRGYKERVLGDHHIHLSSIRSQRQSDVHAYHTCTARRMAHLLSLGLQRPHLAMHMAYCVHGPMREGMRQVPHGGNMWCAPGELWVWCSGRVLVSSCRRGHRCHSQRHVNTSTLSPHLLALAYAYTPHTTALGRRAFEAVHQGPQRRTRSNYRPKRVTSDGRADNLDSLDDTGRIWAPCRCSRRWADISHLAVHDQQGSDCSLRAKARG